MMSPESFNAMLAEFSKGHPGYYGAGKYFAEWAQTHGYTLPDHTPLVWLNAHFPGFADLVKYRTPRPVTNERNLSRFLAGLESVTE